MERVSRRACGSKAVKPSSDDHPYAPRLRARYREMDANFRTPGTRPSLHHGHSREAYLHELCIPLTPPSSPVLSRQISLIIPKAVKKRKSNFIFFLSKKKGEKDSSLRPSPFFFFFTKWLVPGGSMREHCGKINFTSKLDVFDVIYHNAARVFFSWNIKMIRNFLVFDAFPRNHGAACRRR